MCIDFIKVNDACTKDFYQLPSIDHLMDSAAKYKLLSFLDAFNEYHLIHINPTDEEKTSFITNKGMCMPFRLKMWAQHISA